MKSIKSFFYRTFQRIMHIGSYVMPWRIPELIEGENSVLLLPAEIMKAGRGRALVITDSVLMELGLLDSFLSACKDSGLNLHVYDNTVQNPTIENIEEALTLYKETACDCIIAFGGGSPMDCAKGVAARVSRPRKSVRKMAGVLKVLRRKVPLYAVPTTAGTGSETTLAAVITDTQVKRKYAINDHCLIPDYAVLDPVLLKGLPASITAATGMDALCHAVEAFIGKSNTAETRLAAKSAVRLIFENLEHSYNNGGDMLARQNMQSASFKAGLAFTRAYVGYIHALAHTLGATYHVPHGLANAVIMPEVLEYYGASIAPQLAELADYANIPGRGDSVHTKAKTFIQAIYSLNERMGIPRGFDCIKQEDIPKMVADALKEANPLYPVPKVLFAEDLESLYKRISLAPIPEKQPVLN